MSKYQVEYADSRAQMYDQKSRVLKAKNMVLILVDHLGKKKAMNSILLDVGASTGIIDAQLSKHFKKVVGIDIDKGAIKHAKSKFKKNNLIFKQDDAMHLSFKKNTFDIVICTHVYEHVPNASQLFSEIHRVLKPGGVCYLAAVNALWPLEPHYNLPFLSYLPKKYANYYMRIRGKTEYYETPVTYWGLMKLTKKFNKTDYTKKILRSPRLYGYNNQLLELIPPFLLKLIAPIAKYISPTTFWILTKK